MFTLRALIRHPLQFALMTLGIALGVTVMVGIDLANASAERAFDLSASAITGRATHHIIASGDSVDEKIYVQLRADSQWRSQIQSAPVVRVSATSPQMGDTPFTLLGIDPFAEPPFRSYLETQGEMQMRAFAPLLTQPGAVLLSAQTAQRYGLTPCAPGGVDESCRLTLFINGQARQAFLLGLLDPGDDFSRRALDTLILADISTAQSLSGMRGQLTQVDLILPAELDAARLSAALPAGVLLVSSESRNEQVGEMIAAFQINLTALSLLALVVGIFLIYNTMTFSVVQRRPLFGALRSLGYTREQVFGMVIAEASVVGALGAALGLGFGVLLGQGAVRMITQTINDLFFVVSVRGVQIPPASLLKGGMAGLLASVFAAAPPAWEAASVPPRLALSRAGLESKAQGAVYFAAGLGALAAFAGAGILSIPTRNLVVSFAGTFAVILGLAALTPFTTVFLVRWMAQPLGKWFGLLGRLAPRNVLRSQSRTAVAVAALMIAVSVTIGVQVMIASFRSTVALWLDQLLQGDIYVSSQGISSTRLDTPLDPRAVELAQAYPRALSYDAVRVASVQSEYGEVELVAVSPQQKFDPRIFLATQDGAQRALEAMAEGAVLISEPLANRLQISSPGETLTLLTPQGWRSFTVAGIYADYASTRGTVRLSLVLYRALWGDDRLNGISLSLPPGVDVDAAVADLRAQLRDFPKIQVAPSGALRQDAMRVFDRTFAITAAMQMVTTLVAFIGVLSSLLALQIEKAREMAILRALGLTLAEMRRLTLWETSLLGASAGALALPTGYILAWILIFIINQRSFGWTLQMLATPAPFLQAFTLSISAALLAAIYPAWRLSRVEIAESLRGE